MRALESRRYQVYEQIDGCHFLFVGNGPIYSLS